MKNRAYLTASITVWALFFLAVTPALAASQWAWYDASLDKFHSQGGDTPFGQASGRLTSTPTPCPGGPSSSWNNTTRLWTSDDVMLLDGRTVAGFLSVYPSASVEYFSFYNNANAPTPLANDCVGFVVFDINTKIFTGDFASTTQTVWGPLSWSQYWTPTLFATNSQSIATSSGAWGSISIASSTYQCSSGNIFSDGLCSAITYLFVPNPNAVSSFIAVVNSIDGKFPVSWVYGAQSAFNGLSATSTSMTSFNISWGTMGVGTSTPLGLANIAPASTTVFGQTTIEHYIPDSTWQFLQTLIAFGIWLAFLADVFFYARNHLTQV